VESDGHRLDEYDHKRVNPTTETCHIPSESGKPFAVCFKALSLDYYTLSATLRGDGVYVGSRLLRHTDIGRERRIDSAMDSASTERPCIFASLRLTDDETTVRTGPQLEEMGTLKFIIRPVMERGPAPFHGSSQSFPGDNPINERSKKAGAHAIQLGDARPVPTPIFFSTTNVPNTIPHEIIFKYAPIEFLQAQEIAPRTGPTGQPRGEVKEEDRGSPSKSSIQVKSERGVPRKRPQEDDPIVISSDDDDTPEELAGLDRLKAKIRTKREGKKPRLGSAERSNEITIISD